MRGISGRRVEKISARADVRTMCPLFLNPRYGAHDSSTDDTMAVSCAAATSVDHTRKMGEKGRGGRRESVIVSMRFFLWRGGDNVCEAEILCT